MTNAELKALLETGIELIEKMDAKRTKADAKRLRDVLNTIKKSATEIKKRLIDEDKAQ